MTCGHHSVGRGLALDISEMNGLAQNYLAEAIDRANWLELSLVAFEQSASAMDSICVLGELFTILEL